jgi:hypothetical protein
MKITVISLFLCHPNIIGRPAYQKDARCLDSLRRVVGGLKNERREMYFRVTPIRDRFIEGHGAAGRLRFWKIVLLSNAFGNLSPLEFFFAPLNCLIIFIEKKIFNIVHNKIIMQICQNMKSRSENFSSSTWLSITLSFILLLFLICKMLSY